MKQSTHDPEAVALGKIYTLLLKKLAEKNKSDDLRPQVTTIPGDKIQSTKKDLS